MAKRKAVKPVVVQAPVERLSLRNRIKELREVRGGDLQSHPKNFRQHPSEQQSVLDGLLGSIGIADALLAFPADGLGSAGDATRLMVFDGHLRKDRDPSQVWPVLVTDLTRAEADAMLLTLDWSSTLATIDTSLLESLAKDAVLAATLQKETYDAWAEAMSELTGSTSLWDGGPNGRQIVEDAVPDVPKEPISRPGDLWLMGPHRLIVGDSTSPDVWTRLMAGKQAGMVWTDPPYNVAYVGKTKDALVIDNDQMSGQKFREFLKASFDCLVNVTREGGAIYVCHADSEGENFRGALREAGWLYKQCLIWVKNVLVLGRQDYQWRHEPILYGWKPGAAHEWNGGRKLTTVIESEFGISAEQTADGLVLTLNGHGGTVVLRVQGVEVLHAGPEAGESVWRFPKPIRSADHPTMKPVDLPARAIRNSSKPGDIVIDGFCGSGSVLSACHQTERVAYCVELDPRYADVTVRRFEALTGIQAVRG